jgi:hypothetical protein
MADRKSKKLASQLENRKQNLAVIQEAIKADSRNGQKLVPVEEFLAQRIELLENELEFKKN